MSVQFLLCQKLIIDSTFGVNGIRQIDFTGILVNPNLLQDLNNNIELIYNNNLTFYDENGILRNLQPISNPGNIAYKSEFTEFSSAQSSGNYLFIQYKYNPPRTNGFLDYYIRRINVNNLEDSLFGDHGVLKLGSDFENGDSYKIDSQSDIYSIIESDYLKFNRNNVEIIKTNAAGSISQSNLNLDFICNDYATHFLTNIEFANNNSFLFAVQQTCKDSIITVMFKLNSKLWPDSTYGTNGLVYLDKESINSSSLKAIQFIALGKNQNILVVYNDKINNSIIIENYLPDGTLDNNFGTLGRFVINNYLYSLTSNNNFKLDQTNGSLFIFGYDQNENKSKLFVIDKTGNLDPDYEANGGFMLEGKLVNLIQDNSNKFVAVVTKPNFSASNQNYLVRFTERLTETIDANTLSPKIVILNNELLISEIDPSIRSIGVFDLLGNRLHSSVVNTDFLKIGLMNINSISGAALIAFYNINNKVHTMLIPLPK